MWILILLLLISQAFADSKMSAYTTEQPALTDTVVYIKDPSGTPANRKGTVTSNFLAANITVDGTNVGVGSTTPRGRLDLGSGVIYGDGSGLTGVSTGWTDGGTSVYNTTASDNVGIGTLDASTAKLVLKSGTTSSSVYVFNVKDSSNTNLFQILDTGNIGIGTITPGTLLEINGFVGDSSNGQVLRVSRQATEGNDSIFFRIGASRTGDIRTSDGTDLSIFPSDTSNLSFNALPGQSISIGGSKPRITLAGISTGMTVDENTNVGLATTNPTNKLTIYGSVGIGTTTKASSFMQTTAPSGGMIIEGNVGIGSTAPQAKLVIVGTGTGVTNGLSVRDSAFAQKFLVLDNGNVGVGTASPTGGFVVGSGIGVQFVGIGTTVPQLPCYKANRQLGYYDGAWVGTCN